MTRERVKHKQQQEEFGFFKSPFAFSSRFFHSPPFSSGTLLSAYCRHYTPLNCYVKGDPNIRFPQDKCRKRGFCPTKFTALYSEQQLPFSNMVAAPVRGFAAATSLLTQPLGSKSLVRGSCQWQYEPPTSRAGRQSCFKMQRMLT